MRRLRYLLLGLPLAIAPVIACESEEGNGGSQLNIPDGGTYDSAVPQNDGAPSPPPTPTTSVTITAVGNDGPLADVVVVFHDANGAVLETKKTGADGKATSTGATPAMASALLTRNTERHIVTWTGLEAGDDLAVSNFDFQVERGSYDVSLSAPFDGATQYAARVGHCATSGEPWAGQGAASLPLTAGCARSQNAVLVAALDANYKPLANAFSKNVALPGATPLPVSVGAFAAPTDIEVTATNTGESFASSDLFEIVGGTAFDSYSNGEGTFHTATGFAEALQGTAYVGGSSMLALSRRVSTPAPAGSFAFDFAGALPLVEDGVEDDTDVRRPVITWTTSAPTTGSDGGFVRYTKYLGGDMQLVWTLVVPPGATSVKAPALPTEADAWLPSPDAGAQFAFLNVIFVESDLLPSYAAFRRQQGVLFSDTAFFYSSPVLPTNGTLRLSRWGNDG